MLLNVEKPAEQDYRKNVLMNSWFTLSSKHTHFNTLKKKAIGKTLWKKVKLLKMSNFTYYHNVFYKSTSQNPYIATFQLSSAASLNLGRSQNGVEGIG